MIAVLFDRVRYESVAKTVIFLPLAISATAASVIWLFMFAYQPPGTPQTGTLNAAVTSVGVAPQPWLTLSGLSLNTILLVLVTTWIWTGFCMVIISAALKGINVELLEAARVDGANEWQVFRGIIFPLLLPTLAVVSTTIIITALKAFDIVYVMTNGNFDTQVIANSMYQEMFNFGELRPGERDRRRAADRDRPGHGRQHPPVPGPGGDPMTAPSESAPVAQDRSPTSASGGWRSAAGRLHAPLVVDPALVIWLIPTIGLFVNSFRPSADVHGDAAGGPASSSRRS